jgi:hypothetical protein
MSADETRIIAREMMVHSTEVEATVSNEEKLQTCFLPHLGELFETRLQLEKERK